MTVQQLSPGQTYPETPINENNAALGQAFTFTYDKANSTDLDVAITGGVFNGVTLADALLTCPDDAESYIVALRADGALSVIDATDWGDATTYGSVARVTFVSGALTEFADERFSAGGIFDHSADGAIAGPLSGLSDVDLAGTDAPNDGEVLTYHAASGKWIAGAPPVVAAFMYPGVPTASVLLGLFAAPDGVGTLTFAAAMAGSSGKALTAATAQTDIDVRKNATTSANGTSVGTIRWAAAGTVPTFIAASGFTLTGGTDYLSFWAPASPDATLANFGVSLYGTRAA
jgi:hypothetical protein